ncbi:MAG: peptide chain release factor 2 [Planctomycetales bacterium]|nr:peptide chain release factor 2 [Planctomycetales bacterium]
MQNLLCASKLGPASQVADLFPFPSRAGNPPWTENGTTEPKQSKRVFINYRTVFDYAAKQERLKAIDLRMAEPNFWDNQEAAQEVVMDRKALLGIVDPVREALAATDDLVAMVDMAEEDSSFAAEVPGEVKRVESLLESLELKSLLGGCHDGLGAILSINARDGGTDANDWAEMLLRMYIAWAQEQEFKVELLDRNDNDEAGINSATIAIRGPFAYGYLKGETGMHRLVRISPFNAEGKRQTSFAAIDVSPEISDSFDVEIDESDVRVDTFRASGAGGQHVNKTDSAIRLTHVPTGIVVQCQNERSQHKNRAAAWKMLRARLARVEEERRDAEQAEKYQSRAKVGFGSQIRNYFQHPDQRIKDARTNYAQTNFQDVMDGNIQGFLDAYLRWRVKSGGN